MGLGEMAGVGLEGEGSVEVSLEGVGLEGVGACCGMEGRTEVRRANKEVSSRESCLVARPEYIPPAIQQNTPRSGRKRVP